MAELERQLDVRMEFTGVIAMIAKIMRMKDDPVTHSPEDIAAMQARAVING
jgi:hypothetical protein